MAHPNFILRGACLTLIATSLSATVGGAPASLQQGLYKPEIASDMRINHRVLAKPAGVPITSLDLIRRLDLFFRREYPHLAGNKEARYEFYRQSWRPALDEMINNQLILADAKEKKVEVFDGEVRKELEDRFGPNVVETIDSLGITFDQAWEHVKTELTVQKMSSHFVFARALTSISPEKIKQAYEKLVAAQKEKDEWHFRVLTIRHQDPQKAEACIKIAQELLATSPEGTLDLPALRKALDEGKARGEIDVRTTLTLSDLEKRTFESLSPAYQEALAHLKVGALSKPISQVSQTDRSAAYRVFHFIDYVIATPPPFHDVEAQLKNELLHAALVEEQHNYIARLRRHYGFDETLITTTLPPQFQPFT